MKKIVFTIALALFLGNVVALAQEDKEAAKAAQQALKEAKKDANKKLTEGLSLHQQLTALKQANQLEQERGERANTELIAQNEEKMLTVSIEGIGLLTEALGTEYIKDSKKFEAYRALDEMSSLVFSSEVQKAQQKQPYNRKAFSDAIFAQAEACHGQLTWGKPSDPTQDFVIKQVTLKFPRVHSFFAYLCQFCIEAKDFPAAERALDAYIHFPENYPEMADNEQVQKPEYPASQFAFNIFFTAYGEKNLELMEKYYDQALQFDNKDSHNFVLRAKPEILRSLGRTEEWLAASKDVIAKDPESEVAEIFMQQLMSYYGEQGDEAVDQYTAELVEKYPNSKIANYCRGFAFYTKKDFAQAAQYFEKSIEIDPTYSDGIYNCAYCHYQYALEKARAISGQKMKSQAAIKAAEDEVKDYFRKALPYFEKFRELEPDDSSKWASPMHTIYKNIGETDKAAEMEAYM